MKTRTFAIGAALILGLTAVASGHHSFAAYYFEDQSIQIEGEIVEVQFKAPHTWVHVVSREPSGSAKRYAAEWAEALRRMQALRPEALIPGHGPVIFGASRAAQVLDDGATLLESLVEQTLTLMNRGCGLDEVLQTVSAPAELLAKPYLRPKYDDPEFIVRAIWHLYGGWFDGNPAHLKPAPAAELAAELAELAGGADKLADRAMALAADGQTRLAAHLAEFAAGAAPDDGAIQATRAKVLQRCMEQETSLMGRAFLAVYQRDAEARADG